MKVISKSEKETFDFAFELAKKSKIGQVFSLVAELGAGKTVFAKGFASGLCIKENITSPTFNIIKEYYSKINFYHFDVYRIFDIEEMYALDFERYFYSDDGICLVEWANLIEEIIPKDAIWIYIEKINENERIITIKGDI